MDTPTLETDTRRRVLQAAGEVFAERGFHAATVREICRRAHANVAAVNYHFRDKEELYQEVFQKGHCDGVNELAHAVAAAQLLEPEERLRIYIRTFLQHLCNPTKPGWVARLMAHEMISPTAALDIVVRDSIRPQFDRLQVIVRELLGKNASADDVRYFSACVIGQILFWKSSRAVIQRLHSDMTYDAAQLEVIAGYITQFSLHALHGVSGNGAGKNGRAGAGVRSSGNGRGEERRRRESGRRRAAGVPA